MKKLTRTVPPTAYFTDQLKEYQRLIDERIAQFTQEFTAATAEEFGAIPLTVTEAFTDYLSRGGKRVRGALTIATYELFGGTDRDMIVDAALAIEMLQAYILMMDDIQDRSE